MDFDDDHEEQDEEIGMPVSASYGNSSAATAKMVISSSGGGGSGDGGLGGRKSLVVVGQKYRECLKNHAVGIGGHAVDGCGEFMPAGEEGSLDALKCAACNCHRNFHRKETPEGVDGVYNHHQFSQYYRAPTGYLQVAQHRQPTLALPSTSGGGAAGSGDQDEDMSGPSGGGGMGGGSSSKKRFRTKFTQEQKDKMLAFAEKLGWRIQKHDEAAVQQFCTETCVKRHVLKVWMHNNKHTLGLFLLEFFLQVTTT
ncbi:hypothetical protein AQUCO_01500208v1 [Aquilegia coerulea]|uniref:ZF-HD dimerization-type domain-containing protein n=1 Tax=Aquilegia coerulea TaxID=218851 RepID=A0A2G5DSK7_AQUCA|nr:hypothetical protein AQUCO_01500208v1 [Aquilegia coerulea]